MEIIIVVPYTAAEKETAVWANDEDKIDFRKEVEQAARCTTAFAAVELKHFLLRTIIDAIISFSSKRPSHGLFIELNIMDPFSRSDIFYIERCGEGISVTGKGRTGLLYGAYEFLRVQGWRWYAPGKDGEISPVKTDSLIVPKFNEEYKPSMNLSRGFDFEGASKESAELWLWMARNRLNVITYRPATGPLGNKLGMYFKVGGHIFEGILNPDRVLLSGKTIWEEHEDWYGLPTDGIRCKENALRTQFCVTKPDLIEYLAEEFIGCLAGKWKEADLVDVWGFDTWGGICTCDSCKTLGNATDRALYFISALRKHINQARLKYRLDHDVHLIACSYEGTCTIEPANQPIPDSLFDSPDRVVYYPINRCYAHDFNDSSCTINEFYKSTLEKWMHQTPRLPMVIGEYYNVSKFAELPLVVTSRLSHDICFYYAAGIRGMTYMHVPMVNWGVRTLTQVLYAQLLWDIKTDITSFVNEYFVNWYGSSEKEMKTVYDMLEEAWQFIQEWRSWSPRSVLSKLLVWDGRKPNTPLVNGEGHFKTSEDAIVSGRCSKQLMTEAMLLINDVRSRNKKSVDIKGADLYEVRLSEDRRFLIYGLDSITIMTDLVAYHDALYNDNWVEANTLWQKIEQVAERMESYFIPIEFSPNAGLVSNDGLTRIHLRELLRKCRRYISVERHGIEKEEPL
jgi:hypothetical protein